MSDKIHHLRLAFILSIAVLASGCGQDLNDLQQFVQQIKSQPPGEIDPIPEFQPYQNFEYTSQDLRDPFTLVDFRRPEENSGAVELTSSGPRPNTGRVREALENFPLDTLRLKGTLTQDGVKWGLVFAPDNTVHRVVEGNYMGQNHGRIIAINDDVVELTEIVPDGLGNYIERPSAVALVE